MCVSYESSGRLGRASIVGGSALSYTSNTPIVGALAQVPGAVSAVRWESDSAEPSCVAVDSDSRVGVAPEQKGQQAQHSAKSKIGAVGAFINCGYRSDPAE